MFLQEYDITALKIDQLIGTNVDHGGIFPRNSLPATCATSQHHKTP